MHLFKYFPTAYRSNYLLSISVSLIILSIHGSVNVRLILWFIWYHPVGFHFLGDFSLVINCFFNDGFFGGDARSV